jgi:hypothetical protein
MKCDMVFVYKQERATKRARHLASHFSEMASCMASRQFHKSDGPVKPPGQMYNVTEDLNGSPALNDAF